jgi:hypothetical protein
MASTIKVDKIEGSTGSTVTVPTGQTLTVTDGIPVASGGTGLASFTQGDILYATGATTLAKLGKGTTRQGLQTNSGVTAPEWADSPQSLMTAAGDTLYASGANTLAKLAKGSDTEVLTLASGVPSWAAAGGGTTVKRHYFTMATRTAGVAGANDQYEVTDAFTPILPTAGNNDLFVEWVAPKNGSNHAFTNIGLRFNDGSTDYDYPVGNMSTGSIDNLGFAGGIFNIAAGTIPAGTYSIAVRAMITSTDPNFWNPNSSDNATLSTQTYTSIMITEYKN